MGVPLFGVPEVAGPEEYRLDDLTAKLPAARGCLRDVIPNTHLGHGAFSEWLAR
ncbi:hypothetical protein ABZ464_42265 [Streptomyces sp. NPDC005820]|uniref:hypothetical protein n=1 Tax=Streptomyces sp. NPDC005820 TaxID=3157069 RepID=UPI0033C2D602